MAVRCTLRRDDQERFSSVSLVIAPLIYRCHILIWRSRTCFLAASWEITALQRVHSGCLKITTLFMCILVSILGRPGPPPVSCIRIFRTTNLTDVSESAQMAAVDTRLALRGFSHNSNSMLLYGSSPPRNTPHFLPNLD